MDREGNTARTEPMFGDYDIIETVGQGGMAVVYRAHDMALGRIVALKVLKDDLRSNRQVTARFRREGEAFASLNHPNIVHIYSVGSVGRIPYIAMEYIDGMPLSALMKKEKRLPWKRALHLAEQIAAALGCAHESLIIHRDVKPGNVLVDKDGHAYVTDFGIAKVLTAETKLTVDGSRLGTPQYMSPERCQNREITASSDIYSLGVLLFQMVSGRLPYEASSPVALIRKIVIDPPARLSQYISDVPEDVERLIAYMIEKKPADRPGSALEIAELICRVREGKPLVDEDSGIESSLVAFREAHSTPLSASTTQLESTGQISRTIARKLRRWWRRMPESFKVVLIGAPIVVCAAFSGFRVAEVLNRGHAIEAVNEMSRGVGTWTRSSRVADFDVEAEGILRAQILLPGFQVSRLAFSGPDTILVEMTGARRSRRQGQSALCLLGLDVRTAELAIPPKQSRDGRPAFTLVAGSGQALYYARNYTKAGGGIGRGVFATPEGSYGHRAERIVFSDPALDAQVPSAADTIGRGDVSPDGRIMALSANPTGKPGDWVLLAAPVNGSSGGGRAIQLAQTGSPVDWVEFDVHGQRLRYALRTNDGGYELWSVDWAAKVPHKRKTTAGKGRLRLGAVSPAGDYLVRVTGSKAREWQLHLVDVDGGSDEQDLGPGASAVWYPDGEHIIATVPDRRGDLQLWAIPRDNPSERTQLSFIKGGVSRFCSVSPDGGWAVTVTDGQGGPTLLIVDLAMAGLTPQAR